MNVPTQFKAYTDAIDDRTYYILWCDRVNNGSPREYDSFSELDEALDEDVADLFNGAVMTLSFEVPEAESETATPLSDENRTKLQATFDNALNICKEHS